MIEISKIITALTNGLIFALAIIGCNNNISVKDNLSKIKKNTMTSNLKKCSNWAKCQEYGYCIEKANAKFKKMLKLGQMPGIWLLY